MAVSLFTVEISLVFIVHYLHLVMPKPESLNTFLYEHDYLIFKTATPFFY